MPKQSGRFIQNFRGLLRLSKLQFLTAKLTELLSLGMASLSRHIWQIFYSSFVAIDCCCIGQLSPHKHFQTPNLFLILCNIKSYFSKGVSCPVFLSGQYPIHGPLYKCTEHSNFPLQGRGDSKTPIAVVGPNIFLKKSVKILS